MPTITAPDFSGDVSNLGILLGAVLIFGAAWFAFKKLKAAL